ncbi:zinc finger protein Dzip1 [Chelonus insularis]|uniref:zinc finger protein Dzip1 n=1 Tax=Chelonus insularis TaxID=460826 RepID=UPI001588D2CA|nr:zinc finger protein Dzip1 [Chelonus insularis]
MAFSFRTGINWYHDFPKLARDSGFYFNMHKNKVRIDWNRIAGIDIERVIQDRNFLIIDENINSIIDYNLDSEYDVKILDPNFVKLFRLAQLSVEYLLYCKQYLDHSVVILKDELRSKMEENVKLKKELALADEDLFKLKSKYKIFEKMYNESPKDIYKCPYCIKTFSSAFCTSFHIVRRHSNSSQISSSSPVHDQSKTENEKLQDEIKNLKERLNQKERVTSNETEKSPRSVKLNEKNYENQTTDIQSNEVNKDRVVEEEHKKNQEEMNNLITLFFNEIKHLREDEKKSNQLDNEKENLKELLKKQENEIHRLTDQIQELSSQQSAPNLEIIQSKLISQEEYWKSKIDQIEFQHTKDIEELSIQLKMTQEMAERMRNEYIINIKRLEEKSKNFDENVQSVTKPFIVSRQYEENELHRKNSINDKKEKNIKFFDGQHNTVDVEDKVSANFTDSSDKIENDSSNLQNQSHLKSDSLDSREKHSLHETKFKSQSIHSKVSTDEKKIDHTLPKQHSKVKRNLLKTMNTKINASPSQSDAGDSESEVLSQSEDSEESQSTENRDLSSQELTESDQDEFVHKSTISNKKMSHFKEEVLSGLEQKLLDLGVDIEMDGIPRSTYQRLISIVKHHRNISNKKYQALEEIRRNIINKINKKIHNQQQKKKEEFQVYSTPKKSQLKKSINNDKLKMDSSSDIKTHSNTPKIKFEKKSFVKHYLNENNHELLPMKMTPQKIQDLNTTRSKSLKLKQDESSKRLSTHNKKKSSSSQVIYVNENTDKFVNNEKHKATFSPKSLKQNNNNKDDMDILSIDDDDDENENSSHHEIINIYKEFNKFPQPAPRVSKENVLGTV